MSQPAFSSADGFIGESFFTMFFNVALDAGHPPLSNAFNVQVNGTDVTVTGVTVDSVAMSVKVTLSTTLLPGDIIDFVYTDPTVGNDINAIQGTDGSDAASFSHSTIVAITRPGPTELATITALSSDTGSSASDFITNTAAQTVSGTLSAALGAGETVQVSTNGSTWVNATTVGTTWSVALTLPAGSGTLSVRTIDSSNNTAAGTGHTFTLDTTAPANPVITSAALTDVAVPTIAGTAEAGATVTVVVGGATYHVAAGSGTWSLNLASATPATGTLALNANGTNAVTATATDPAGNVSGNATQTLTIDTTVPVAPTITSALLTNSVTPVIAGTAEAGSTVTVVVGGATYHVAAGSGTWSLNLATATPVTGALALNTNGTNAVVATATDAAGNTSSADTETLTIDTTPPASPVITSTALTDNAAPTITGTAEAGATVRVVVAGATYTTAAGLGGTWSLNLATATPIAGSLALNANGNNLVTATATDPAGNTSTEATQTLIVDTTAPNAPVITSGTITNDVTPAIAGTADAGSTVTVVVGGATYVTIANDGTWAVDLATATPESGVLALDPNGPNAVRATATDPAGNVSSDVEQTLTLDTTPPAAPAITSPAITNDTTPVIAGTAEAGTTVTIVVAGATYTTIATNGTWAIDLGTATPVSGTLALDDNGTNSVVATSTDPAGNLSPNAPQTLTIDTTAPVVSANLEDNPHNGHPAGSIYAQLLNGTGAANTAVTIKDGGVVIGSALSDATGAWTFDLSILAAGNHVLTASQTDSAGNTGGTEPMPLTISPAIKPDTRFDLDTGNPDTSGSFFGSDFIGVSNGLQAQYGYTGTNDVTVTANVPDVFIYGGSGNDVVIGKAGSNVISGNGGSNWLIGATGADGGNDTFYVDDVTDQTTWDTALNFHVGDHLTYWHYNAAQGSVNYFDNLGAAGYLGTTVDVSLGDGSGASKLVTFAGVSGGAAHFVSSTGEVGGVDYLYITRTT